jgi:Fur family ferric uptake transcriptional regulator
MSASGMILKIDVTGTQKRFDATITPHYHIRCSCCDRVNDIDMPVSTSLVDIASTKTPYLITGHHVEFTGLCPDCRRHKGL